MYSFVLLASERDALLTALEGAIAQRRAFAERSRIAGASSTHNSVPTVNALLDKMVVYVGDQTTPNMIERLCRTVGLFRVRRLQTALHVASQNYPIDLEQLELAMAEDIAHGLVPLMVVAAVGGSGTSAIDPVETIGLLCQRCGVWLHVTSTCRMVFGGSTAG